MITLKRLNVERVVATEDAAQKLELLGFHRIGSSDDRKPYTAPIIEVVGAFAEKIPDGTPGEEIPDGTSSEVLSSGSLASEVPDSVPENAIPIVSTVEPAQDTAAEEVEQNVAGADKPHRGGSKK